MHNNSQAFDLTQNRGSREKALPPHHTLQSLSPALFQLLAAPLQTSLSIPTLSFGCEHTFWRTNFHCRCCCWYWMQNVKLERLSARGLIIMDMSSASHLGSTHSSPESFDDDTGMMGATNWQHMAPPVQTAPPSVAGSSTTSSAPTKTPLPLQKRRRVTRACDECRRKKIKCDGKQPCTHCTVYSYGLCIYSVASLALGVE